MGRWLGEWEERKRQRLHASTNSRRSRSLQDLEEDGRVIPTQCDVPKGHLCRDSSQMHKNLSNGHSPSLSHCVCVCVCFHKNLITSHSYYKPCQDEQTDILRTSHLSKSIPAFPLSICVPLTETCTKRIKEQRVILGRILGGMPTWEPSATVILFSQSGPWSPCTTGL